MAWMLKPPIEVSLFQNIVVIFSPQRKTDVISDIEVKPFLNRRKFG